LPGTLKTVLISERSIIIFLSRFDFSTNRQLIRTCQAIGMLCIDAVHIILYGILHIHLTMTFFLISCERERLSLSSREDMYGQKFENPETWHNGADFLYGMP
jgi:hypothetical protein